MRHLDLVHLRAGNQLTHMTHFEGLGLHSEQKDAQSPRFPFLGNRLAANEGFLVDPSPRCDPQEISTDLFHLLVSSSIQRQQQQMISGNSPQHVSQQNSPSTRQG